MAGHLQWQSPRTRASAMAVIVMALVSGCAVGLGYNVAPRQETLVQPGMTPDQVLSVLGQPVRNMQYRNQPGPTFTYRVIGSIPPMLFDVDFGADNKVAATSERMDLDRGGRHGLGGFR